MSPITPENLPLIKIVQVFIFFVHLPFVAFLMGGSLVALLLEIYGRLDRHPHFRRFAPELLERATLRKSLALLILLAVAISLLCVELSYSPLGLGVVFPAGVLGLLTAGLTLLYLYRFLIRRGGPRGPLGFISGFAGLGSMLLAYCILMCGAALLLMPDEWPHLSSMPGLILSWNGVWKFLQFLTLAGATSGAGILLLGSAASRPPTEDPAYSRFIQRTGAVLTLGSLLLWPPFLVLDLFTLPFGTRSPFVFVLAGVALLVALVVAYLLLRVLEQRPGQYAKAVLAGCLALFLAWTLTDHVAREGILNAQTLASEDLMRTAFRAGAPKTAEPAKVPGKPEEVEETAAAEGKAVFEQICSGCHRFDQRLVGPPLNQVLGKYRGELEKLKAFIRKPEKVNPDYPPMPVLGLSEAKIDSVAKYLLRQAQQ